MVYLWCQLCHSAARLDTSNMTFVLRPFVPPQFGFSGQDWERQRDCGGFLHSFYSGHFLTSNALLFWHRERLSVTGQRRPEGAQVSILCMDCTLGGSAHKAVGGGVGWGGVGQRTSASNGKSSNPERRRQERGGKLTADLFSGRFKTIAGDISKLFGWECSVVCWKTGVCEELHLCFHK